MSKLLARAKVKLENAERNYLKIGIDDAYMDDCCYNLQQSIEMTLKWLVEINGKDYVENHDLRAQINKLKKLNVTIPGEDRISELASEILSWEKNSRYNDNFSALVPTVTEVLDITKKLIEFAESKVCTVESATMEIPDSRIDSGEEQKHSTNQIKVF